MELSNEKKLTEEAVQEGAKAFELFWLLPRRKDGETARMRMKIQGKWSGWKLKDELVRSLGLMVGDTINANVKVEGNLTMIDDDAEGDLFASGDTAEWLIENRVGNGAVIDGEVRFMFHRAPVGGINGRDIMKTSIILEKVLCLVESMKEEESSIL